MRKLQKAVDTASIAVSSIILGIMMIVLIYNVFARFLRGGISWYMEFSQYTNVWAMLIAGIGICANGQHLRISALDEVLKGKPLIVLRVLVALATIAFYLCLTYGGFLLATKSKQVISTMAPLKMAYVYWMIPVCALLSACSSALHAAIDIRGLMKGGEGA